MPHPILMKVKDRKLLLLKQLAGLRMNSKNISTAASPLLAGCWANRKMRGMWQIDHVQDPPCVTNQQDDAFVVRLAQITPFTTVPQIHWAAPCPNLSQCLFKQSIIASTILTLRLTNLQDTPSLDLPRQSRTFFSNYKLSGPIFIRWKSLS